MEQKYIAYILPGTIHSQRISRLKVNVLSQYYCTYNCLPGIVFDPLIAPTKLFIITTLTNRLITSLLNILPGV